MAEDSPFLDDEEAAELENRRQLAAIGGLPANNANGLIRNVPERGRRPRRQAITPVGNAMPMFDNAHEGAAIAGMMHAQHGNALQRAITQTTNAIQDENDRRVAISREMRRMEHERWKMMQQMALAREKMQMDSANQIRSLRQRAAMNNPTQTRTLRQDPMTGEYRWMEDWEM